MRGTFSLRLLGRSKHAVKDASHCCADVFADANPLAPAADAASDGSAEPDDARTTDVQSEDASADESGMDAQADAWGDAGEGGTCQLASVV